VKVEFMSQSNAPQTFANVAAWSASFGGVAAALSSGAVLIPLSAAVVGAGLGLIVSKRLDEAQFREQAAHVADGAVRQAQQG
jgi:hypothetical protein